MEVKTRRRVLLDTTPRRLGRWLLLSAVLHAPFTPVAGLIGLIGLLKVPEDEGPLLPPLTEIPLDIIEDEAPPPKAEPAPPEAAAAPPEPVTPKEPDPASIKAKPPKKEVVDAGAPDAGKDEPDAGPVDAGAPPENRRPGDGIADPVSGIGNRRVVDPNANVRVVVFNDRVRRHPLGGQVGPLLRNVYQWRDFFGPTAIDPIRDIDRMLIAGPQLRDSRNVVAILQFNVPQERVRAAVDVLVARDPEGGWLDAGVPVAKARADRGERVFVFPAPQVLVVSPPATQAAAERLGRKFRLPAPKGDEIAVAHLEAPHRAFIGLPVVIPKSIRSADIRLSPAPDGGVIIDLLAHDETEPLARENAEKLTRALEAATTLDLGLLGSILGGSSKKKFIEKGTFEPDGTDIRGEIVLTRKQVEQILGYAGAFLGGSAPKPLPAASTAPTAPTAPTTPTPSTAP